MRNRQLSVSALVRYLKGKLDQDSLIQRIVVAGEISSFTAHRSGHWYFTLKDEHARIQCVMFASYAQRVAFRPKEGDSVLVQANTSVFEASGQLQLLITAMKPTGLGDLYLQFEQLKRRLNAEGLFDPSRKKSLPRYPMNLCVITGRQTAAREDVITTLHRRWPVAQVSEIPVLVQGDGAAAQICAALRQADAMHFDVIILARGGGSIEDLWSFNEECVARTLAAMHTPVICGVGHEVDVTIADLACDCRAPTPTGAAEMATPQIGEVLAQLHRQHQQLCLRMQQQLTQQRRQLQQLQDSRIFEDPMSLLQKAQMHLDYNSSRLQNCAAQLRQHRQTLNQLSHTLLSGASRLISAQRRKLSEQQLLLTRIPPERLKMQHQQLSQKIQLLDAMSPLKVLARGYGLVYDGEKLVRSVKETELHQPLRIRLQDGLLDVVVTKKEEQK